MAQIKDTLQTNAIRKCSPVMYINSNNLIEEAGKHIISLGNKALISSGHRAWDAVKEKLTSSLNKSGIKSDLNLFIGNCCDTNISIIKEKAKHMKANVIIGIGGGKSLDAAKAAADDINLPIVCIPTIAATCAAVTALSVIYNDEGIYQRAWWLKVNPNLVLVDPIVITSAPVIYTQSGIMDAISKWIEGQVAAKVVKDMDIFNYTALSIAELLYKNLLLKGPKAIESININESDKNLIDVIDLAIYFAGIIQALGPDLARGGIAHAVYTGLTIDEENRKLLHGILVGYGIMIQLILENKTDKELPEILSFYKKINFIPSLKNLNIKLNKDKINKLAEKTCAHGYMQVLQIKKEMIIDAVEKLEELMS